jgi:hypothetical protein
MMQAQVLHVNYAKSPFPFCTSIAPFLSFNQWCGSRRFLTGSGYNFRKRPDLDSVPDPDPDLNTFSDKFLLKIFFAEICS